MTGVFLLFLCCTKSNIKKESFFILVKCENRSWNDRNNEDYIKLWVNDSLLFAGTYYTNYVDSTQSKMDNALGMQVASIDKTNKDSIKIRILLVSLDSILFANKRVMDTTFFYRIDNIPGIAISDTWRRGYFSIFDTIAAPIYWWNE